MAAGGRRAALADVLTLDGAVTVPEGRGLASVPERYRFQFLTLAADRMPRATQARIARTAGRLAQKTLIPAELREGRPEDLDAWFREHAAEIVKRANSMTRMRRLPARARALWRR